MYSASDNTCYIRFFSATLARCNILFFRSVLVAFWPLFLLICPNVLWAQTEPQSLEYKIKAAYLYNFTKFITWPDAVDGPNQNTTFSICIIEHNPFGYALDLLNNRKVNELDLVTEIIPRNEIFDHCQIVFIPKELNADYPEILKQIKSQHILTVSDITGFAHNGGHIGLNTVNGKVRFDINLASTKASSLKVSAKLLELALTVIEE